MAGKKGTKRPDLILRNKSPEHREKVRRARLGMKFTKEHRENISKCLMGSKRRLGCKHTEETKRKISQSKIGNCGGEKHPQWKGGISKERDKAKQTQEYKNWRNSVFERDAYTCQRCLDKNGLGKTIRLEAHHILSYADFPEERLEPSNGATVCFKCHHYIHSNEAGYN